MTSALLRLPLILCTPMPNEAGAARIQCTLGSFLQLCVQLLLEVEHLSILSW